MIVKDDRRTKDEDCVACRLFTTENDSCGDIFSEKYTTQNTSNIHPKKVIERPVFIVSEDTNRKSKKNVYFAPASLKVYHGRTLSVFFQSRLLW